MIIGTVKEKELAINILCQSFQNIKIPNSINFIVGLENDRSKRLRALMSYQYDMCLLFGSAFITSDFKGVILYLEKPKQTLKRIYLELKLILKCIGFSNVFRVLRRENIIRKNHPDGNFAHLWLMGVLPESQGKGVGSKLINESMKVVENEKIFLETSAPENLEFYKKNGFSIFKETHQLNYPLYFLSNV